jgi:hypothetical protein
MLCEDVDGDGWDAPADCDDGDPAAHPEATEVPYDGIDQDCDGADLVDQDEDGVPALAAGGSDCDDLDPSIAPGRDEVCGDRIDQDCDGAVDEGCAIVAEDLAPGGTWVACATDVGAGEVGGDWVGVVLAAVVTLKRRR